jgi:predicted neutral ceramidase superfamily lipid hydrolase
MIYPFFIFVFSFSSFLTSPVLKYIVIKHNYKRPQYLHFQVTVCLIAVKTWLQTIFFPSKSSNMDSNMDVTTERGS